MGLDQYGLINPQPAEVRFTNDRDEFHWRKHGRLQAFMEQLWKERGNKGDFNCDAELELSHSDLLRLKQAIHNGYHDYPAKDSRRSQWQERACKEYLRQDLAFVERALDSVSRGEKVVYTCWW